MRDHDIDVVRTDLPDGFDGILAVDHTGNAVVLLDRHLLRAERDAVLWHELVHLERGGSGWRPGLPPHLEALVEKEETRVRQLVAERMVPDAELAEFVRRRGTVGAVTARDVADEFEVTPAVATEAMMRLARRQGLAA